MFCLFGLFVVLTHRPLYFSIYSRQCVAIEDQNYPGLFPAVYSLRKWHPLSSISRLLHVRSLSVGSLLYFPFSVLMVSTLLLTVSHHLKGFVKEIFDAPSTSSDHPDSCYDDTFFLPFTLSVHLSFPFLSAALTLLDHVTLLFKVQVMWHDITGALVPIKGPGFHHIPWASISFHATSFLCACLDTSLQYI